MSLIYLQRADLEWVSYIDGCKMPELGLHHSVCDYCGALEKVLTDLMGRKVAKVVKKRVSRKLHGESQNEKAGPETRTLVLGSTAVI
jgi:hypothetical protein